MKRSVFALLSLASAAAYYNKPSNVSSGICSYEATCSANGYEGACVSISSGCCSGGTVTSGLCPGDSDIKCCTTPSCSTPSGSGSCMSTSECSAIGGNSVSGYCAGPSDLQCCVKSLCDYDGTCSAGGYEGVCVSVSSGCCSGGTVTSGLCPGDSDIKCCTAHACSTPYGSGTCMQTSACGGTSVAGYCTGPSDLQCCLGSSPSTTTYGVDVSTTITSDAAACFAASGISYVIPRGYESIGDIDYRVCNSLTAAANAGIPTRDVYLFPCPTCDKSASTQMGELVNYLRSNCPSQWSGRVWLDIEGTDYWTGDYGVNQNWFAQLKDSCSAWGVSCGVYSSYYQWESIFGSISFVYGNELPLWYAHYDDNPSFSDFNAFGGWSSPHAKQYSGTSDLCGMGVDQNYSPSF